MAGLMKAARPARIRSFKDFGALGGGVVDDTAAIQRALNSGDSIINGDDGYFRITDTLTVATAGQRVRLSPGCTIRLENADVSKRALVVNGAGARVEGGAITSLQRRDFLVTLFGEKTELRGTELYFATAPGGYPLDDALINYNKGGVEMRGQGAVVRKCEIYHFIGFGVISYAGDQKIEENDIHNCGTGIHLDHAEPGVRVKRNRVEDCDGIGVLANRDGIQFHFTWNEIYGNGSHGAYLRPTNSIIVGNEAMYNRNDGIKTRDVVNSTIFNNTACFNNTGANPSGAEIRLQINEFGSDKASYAMNVTASTNEATTASFALSYAGTSKVTTRLSVVGNNVQNMIIGHSDGLLCASNMVSGRLLVGLDTAGAPPDQRSANVLGNVGGILQATGRLKDSLLQSNVFDHLFTPSTGGNVGNAVRLNIFKAQNVPFERRFFDEFSSNRINVTVDFVGPLLKQANNATDNTGKVIAFNRVTGHAEGLIADTVNTVSGSKNVLIGNVMSSTTKEMFGMWGSGHTVIGNVALGAMGTGYVGVNDSWMIGNSPKLVERTGTTGNQNI